MTRELTGRHVLFVMICAFGVIIAANLTMLFSAVGSFPGLVVQNAYVESQGWNDRAARQQALGWTATVSYEEEMLVVSISDSDGNQIEASDVLATVGRPTYDGRDVTLTTPDQVSPFRFAAKLEPGRWRVHVSAGTDPSYRSTAQILVHGSN